MSGHNFYEGEKAKMLTRCNNCEELMEDCKCSYREGMDMEMKSNLHNLREDLKELEFNDEASKEACITIQNKTVEVILKDVDTIRRNKGNRLNDFYTGFDYCIKEIKQLLKGEKDDKLR